MAVRRVPSRNAMVVVSEGSWLIWRMADTGLANVSSLPIMSSSIIASTIAVVPTLR